MKKYHVSIIVDTEDKNPNVFEEISGLKATRKKIKGEPFINQAGVIIKGKTIQENTYRYTFEDNFFNDCIYQNHCIEKVLNFIMKNSELYNALKIFPLSSIFITVFYSDEDRPYLHLNKELLKLMNEINIPISIDSY